jgi:hypothetical protein
MEKPVVPHVEIDSSWMDESLPLDERRALLDRALADFKRRKAAASEQRDAPGRAPRSDKPRSGRNERPKA